MKPNLSKWNPFKFLRKTAEEKRSEPSASAAMATSAGALPGDWSDLSRLLLPNPLRLMQELLRDPFTGPNQPERWFGDFSPSMFQPRIDVVDDGEALRITAELPGMTREDLEIAVEDEFLMLRGEKKLESKNEEKGCYHLERAFGSFQRIIPLPDGVDLDRVEARFDKGVLTLRLPKSTTQKSSTRRIEIK